MALVPASELMGMKDSLQNYVAGSFSKNHQLDMQVDRYFLDNFVNGNTINRGDLGPLTIKDMGGKVHGSGSYSGQTLSRERLRELLHERIEGARETGALESPMVNAYFQCTLKALGDTNYNQFPGAMKTWRGNF